MNTFSKLNCMIIEMCANGDKLKKKLLNFLISMKNILLKLFILIGTIYNIINEH